MNYTTQIKGEKARKRLLKGAKMVYDVVSSTLGARGRNTVLHKGFEIQSQNDGVTIARTVEPKNRYENAGANILKESAEKQVTNVGDGTTLVIILGYSIMREAIKLIESGVNPMGLKEGLERSVEILTEEIDKLSTKVKNKAQKIDVATIASTDKKIGKMIGETLHKIGLEGVLVADKSNSGITELEHQEGLQLNAGYHSPYFATDPRDMSATLRETHILITDKIIENIYDILPFIDSDGFKKSVKSFLVIAPELKGTALASFVQTKLQGKMSLLATKTPVFGNYQKELLEDVAIMTGGTFVSSESGLALKDLKVEHLGYAEVVKATKSATTIMGNKGSLKDIKDRKASLRKMIDDPENDFEKEKLRERLAKLSGGVYVLKVGGITDLEMKERRERAEDSILATRAAIKGGIVPGGEVIFLPILKALVTKDENEEYAFRIMRKALEKPFAKLLTNAGLNYGYYLSKLESEPFGYGVDVTDNQVKDMKKSGIIDPTLVLKEAIKNAVSVAISIITSEGIVVLREKKK